MSNWKKRLKTITWVVSIIIIFPLVIVVTDGSVSNLFFLPLLYFPLFILIWLGYVVLLMASPVKMLKEWLLHRFNDPVKRSKNWLSQSQQDSE